MFRAIHFKNFRVLKDTTLPLGRCTILVGANGSGKSTALAALDALCGRSHQTRASTLSIGADELEAIEVSLEWAEPLAGLRYVWSWKPNAAPQTGFSTDPSPATFRESPQNLSAKVNRIRVYSLDPRVISQPRPVDRSVELSVDGAGLASVMDRLRDNAPERFEALDRSIEAWFPEFDKVLFDSQQGNKTLMLRRRGDGAKLRAEHLSQGTLIALAVLTLSYVSEPPPIIGFEEIDRGLHPRLLTQVRDALYRICYPEDFGESREPVQVIATTHSPYFLDLFRDHPEDVVIAERINGSAVFKPISAYPKIDEIISETPLGEAWFSGVLGGVPAIK